MKRIHRQTCAALATLLMAGAAAHAQERAPSVARIATNVERSYFPPAEALLTKAYATMGLQTEYLAWPLQRSLLELRSGRLDGVAMRVDAFFEQVPFIRKVDVPLVTLSVYAYGRPPCPAAVAPEALSRFRVSYQRGMVAAEALIPEAARVPANTPSDAFLNVAAGVADFALTLTTPWFVEVPVVTAKGALCRVATPLARLPLFHGVHESHADWIAPLEQALRRMRDRGEIAQAWSDYERYIDPQNARLQAQPGRALILGPATPGSAPGPAPAPTPQ